MAVVALKNLIFTVVVPGTVAVYVPSVILFRTGALEVPGWGPLRVLGGVALAAGIAVYGWCVFDFARARGTPAPIDPPRELVARGLYRCTRNPMYVGVLSAVLGESLLFRSLHLLAYAAGLFTMFHLFVRLYEEPSLTRRFGDAYVRYRETVPRWLPLPPRRQAQRP